ncbi:MAG TPA: hypothetical protein VK892_09340 [Pyrinomonadaceae bacterium]|nr:hypothetical protein [Pyrinomonadaceae bacterium]
MKVPFGKNTTISRLRVPYSGDQLAARLRYASLFGGMDLHPASLPPNAVVCIRKLRNPQPQNLQLNRAAGRFSDTWRDSVSREIEKLYRRAYRPIRESVPALAESIVFADYAELLASLAIDWCKGTLIQNWWWRSIFPNLQQAQTIARIWIESAEFVPSALQLLANQGKAVEFAAKLQPDEAAGLLRQIIRVFDVYKLQSVFFESFDGKEEFSALPVSETIERQVLPEETSSMPFQQTAPWFQFVPEIRHSTLSFEQQSLLGIGLTLARSPRIARSAEFARQVKEFRIEFETGRKAGSRSKDKIPERTAKPGKRQEKIEKFHLRKEEPKSQPILPESKIETEKLPEKKAVNFFEDSINIEEKPVKPPKSSEESKSEIPFPEEKSRKSPVKFLFEDSSPEKNFDRAESKRETKPYQTEKQFIPQTDSLEISEEAETQFEFIVETKFGGVFYLLNLGLYLNLYRDFSEPAETEIDLNIWDFVALLGLEFLGEKLKDDPVWKLLEHLSGRENEEELGQGFIPPGEWRMPPEWLETFQTEQKWLLIKTQKRLVVRHPAGFSVIDVPLLDDWESDLENDLKIYGKGFSEIAKSDLRSFPEYSPSAASWVKTLTKFARKRLAQALNLQTEKQINSILFERKATITVTTTHLDVTFRLADLPFEVRLSGLDRNPGWIPAAGKYVKFHFI